MASQLIRQISQLNVVLVVTVTVYTALYAEAMGYSVLTDINVYISAVTRMHGQ